jgi:hypothetical protein
MIRSMPVCTMGSTTGGASHAATSRPTPDLPSHGDRDCSAGVYLLVSMQASADDAMNEATSEVFRWAAGASIQPLLSMQLTRTILVTWGCPHRSLPRERPSGERVPSGKMCTQAPAASRCSAARMPGWSMPLPRSTGSVCRTQATCLRS